MKKNGFIKSKTFRIIDQLDYLPNSVVNKSVIRKPTGIVSALSFDTGEMLSRKISPFDNLIQIIEGKAEIIIEGISNLLETGDSIIIPAHSQNSIKANVKFKMLSTMFKSGYEEINL